MSGYTKAHRARFKHPLFEGEEWCRGYAWDWMVSEAMWRPREIDAKGKIVTLERGQFSHSVRFMADIFGWSKSSVDRFLRRLKTGTMIETDNGTGQLVITICNYEKYQADIDEAGTESGTGAGTKLGQQRDKEEELKEIKEENKKDICPSQPSPVDDIAEAVNHFNATAEHVGWPRVQKVSATRRKTLTSRLKDAGGIDGWRLAIDRAASSQFLTEQWGATFDWLIKDSNFTKVMEGNYDNRINHRPSTGPRNGPDPALEQIARLTGIGEAQRSGGV